MLLLYTFSSIGKPAKVFMGGRIQHCKDLAGGRDFSALYQLGYFSYDACVQRPDILDFRQSSERHAAVP